MLKKKKKKKPGCDIHNRSYISECSKELTFTFANPSLPQLIQQCNEKFFPLKMYNSTHCSFLTLVNCAPRIHSIIGERKNMLHCLFSALAVKSSCSFGTKKLITSYWGGNFRKKIFMAIFKLFHRSKKSARAKKKKKKKKKLFPSRSKQCIYLHFSFDSFKPILQLPRSIPTVFEVKVSSAFFLVVVLVVVVIAYRPKAQSGGEDKLRGSQSTLDIDVTYHTYTAQKNHIKTPPTFGPPTSLEYSILLGLTIPPSMRPKLSPTFVPHKSINHSYDTFHHIFSTCVSPVDIDVGECHALGPNAREFVGVNLVLIDERLGYWVLPVLPTQEDRLQIFMGVVLPTFYSPLFSLIPPLSHRHNVQNV